MNKNICWRCGGKIVWDGDFLSKEIYGEGEGIISILHCTNNMCNAEIKYTTNVKE